MGQAILNPHPQNRYVTPPTPQILLSSITVTGRTGGEQ